MSLTLHTSLVEKSLPSGVNMGANLLTDGTSQRKLFVVAGAGIGVLGILCSYYLWRLSENYNQNEEDLFHVDGELKLFSSNLKKHPTYASPKGTKAPGGGLHGHPTTGRALSRAHEEDHESFYPLASTSSSDLPTLHSLPPIARHADPRLSFGAQQARAIRQVVAPIEYKFDPDSSSSSSRSSSLGLEVDARSHHSDHEIMYHCAKLLVKEAKENLLTAMVKWEAEKSALQKRLVRNKRSLFRNHKSTKKNPQQNALAHFLDLAAEYLELVHEKRKIKARRDRYHHHHQHMDVEALEEDGSGEKGYHKEEKEGPLRGTEGKVSRLQDLFPLSSIGNSSVMPPLFHQQLSSFKERHSDPILTNLLSLGEGHFFQYANSPEQYRSQDRWEDMMEDDDFEEDFNGFMNGRVGGLVGRGPGEEQAFHSYLAAGKEEDPLPMKYLEEIKEKLQGLDASEKGNRGGFLAGSEETEEDDETLFPEERISGGWGRVSDEEKDFGEGGERRVEKKKAMRGAGFGTAFDPTLDMHEKEDEDWESVSEVEEIEEDEEDEEQEAEEEENETMIVEEVLRCITTLAAEWRITPEEVESLEREFQLQKQQAKEARRQSLQQERKALEDMTEKNSNGDLEQEGRPHPEVNHEAGEEEEEEWEDVEEDENEESHNDEKDDVEEIEGTDNDRPNDSLPERRSGKEWWSNVMEGAA